MPYSGDPGASLRDAVFFRVGDTDAANPELADKEVNYLLTLYGNNVISASIEAARALEAKYAGLADSRTVGDLSISYSKKAERFRELKMELIALASGSGAGANPLATVPMPYAGGLRISDKQTDVLDTDMVQPDFIRDITDEPQTASAPTDASLDGQPF